MNSRKPFILAATWGRPPSAMRDTAGRISMLIVAGARRACYAGDAARTKLDQLFEIKSWRSNYIARRTRRNSDLYPHPSQRPGAPQATDCRTPSLLGARLEHIHVSAGTRKCAIFIALVASSGEPTTRQVRALERRHFPHRTSSLGAVKMHQNAECVGAAHRRRDGVGPYSLYRALRAGRYVLDLFNADGYWPFPSPVSLLIVPGEENI